MIWECSRSNSCRIHLRAVSLLTSPSRQRSSGWESLQWGAPPNVNLAEHHSFFSLLLNRWSNSWDSPRMTRVLNPGDTALLQNTQCFGLREDSVSWFLTARPWVGIVVPVPPPPTPPPSVYHWRQAVAGGQTERRERGNRSNYSVPKVWFEPWILHKAPVETGWYSEQWWQGNTFFTIQRGAFKFLMPSFPLLPLLFPLRKY